MAAVSVGKKLRDLLGQVTAGDLAELDQEIEAKRDEIAKATEALQEELKGLLAVRKVLAARLGVKPPTATARRSPVRRRRTAEDGESTNGAVVTEKNAMQIARRKRIAALLGIRGPLAPMAIANECEIPQGSITSVLDCEWFERTPQGIRLTAIGRKEAGL